MEKMKRSQRVAFITRTLSDSPGRMFSLGYFADTLNSAKSTVSEDISIIRDVLAQTGQGIVQTFPGAAGGVMFRPWVGQDKALEIAERLRGLLMQPDRLLAGGYIYMTDVIFSPVWSQELGSVFARCFEHTSPQYVITMETKGIPMALMTARALGVPLVILRREARVTEGSSVSINYVSGSTGRIQTMSLPRRAMREGARVVFIDDFMKAGGTARGVRDIVAEFSGRVVGTGVLLATVEPENKMVEDFLPLLTLSVEEPPTPGMRLTLASKLRQALAEPGEADG